MFYKNLTIGSYATLKPKGSVQVICVAETLTLNGVIDVSGFGAGGGASATGGGAGGAGGGGIIIIAKNIVGLGSILANGLNGGNASTPTAYGGGGSGGSGVFRGLTIGAGSGGGSSNIGGLGGVSPKDPRFLLIHDDWLFMSPEHAPKRWCETTYSLPAMDLSTCSPLQLPLPLGLVKPPLSELTQTSISTPVVFT